MRPGQRYEAQRVMVVVIDTAGQAHGWDVEPALAEWEMVGITGNGLGGGRSVVRIRVEGPMRRRTRRLEDLDMQVSDRWEPPEIGPHDG